MRDLYYNTAICRIQIMSGETDYLLELLPRYEARYEQSFNESIKSNLKICLEMLHCALGGK